VYLVCICSASAVRRQKFCEDRPIMRNFTEIRHVISEMKYAGGRMDRTDLVITYRMSIFYELFAEALGIKNVHGRIPV
jgi:hypothetical protein